MLKTLIVVPAVTATVAAAASASASAQGFVEDELVYGYYYGTFDESPDIALFAGGTFEEFCSTDPGSAPSRVFERQDGVVDVKVNAKDQPIYLYYTDSEAPDWLEAVCPEVLVGAAPPEPFATGLADLKVRDRVISPDRVKVFNSVNGTATGIDGTEYKVRASADLVVVDGVPLGEPRDFVGFTLTEIRR